MIRGSREYNIVTVFLPVFAYFILMRLTAMILVYGADIAGYVMSGTLRQLICMLTGLAVIYPVFYRKEKRDYKVWHELNLAGDFGIRFDVIAFIFSMAVSLLACFGANNIATLIDVSSYSKEYSNVEQTLYSGGILTELIAYVIVSPLAEEILYRGVVFFRIRRTIGRMSAVIVSSVLFSIFHANLIQALYSLFVGFLLGLFMEYYQNIAVVIAGHAAANFLSVIRKEYQIFSIEKMGSTIYLLSAVIAILLVLLSAVYIIYRMCRRINIIQKD